MNMPFEYDSALGPDAAWPQSLRTAASLCLASHSPTSLIWGPQRIHIPNDHYRRLCGDSHATWPGAADAIERAYRGQATQLGDQRLFVPRSGRLEERCFTMSFTPVRDESGQVGGVLHALTDTTAAMLAERRALALRELGAELGSAADRAGLAGQLIRTLARFDLDLPFVLLYELDHGSGEYRLAGATGMAAGADCAALPLPDPVPAAAALRMDLGGSIAPGSCGPYGEPPRTAYALPAGARPGLLLMAGVSARLPLDESYAGFYTLLQAVLAAALARVDAAAAARDRAALVDSRLQADDLFEQTTVGMAEASLDGILLNVNQRYCDMIGLPREDLVGRRVDAFLHPEDAPDNRALFAALAGGGAPYELENRFLRPDGGVIWVGKTVTAVRGRNGGPATVLAVYMDVTERKEAEAALHEAARRKDEFLAMLAHELRNPLAPIRAAAEMMGMAQLDAARSRRVSEIIGRQVRHMTALIDDLLDVSRVTRGLVEIGKAPQEVQAIVANAVEQVRPLIESQRHSLVVTLDPAGGRVLGDEKRLVQILTNLLNNAAKYTPAGGAIALRTETEDDCVHVIVSDTGIGIAPALRTHVFDLFAQAERTPDRSQGGLGLGLALVKSLVQLHGGRVACHSGGLGKGSTFIVQLPRLPEWRTAPAAGPAAAPVPGRTKPLDILVVDDNADAAFMLKLLLEQWGHRVTVEHDAYRALDSAARQAPDVALLDIGLPGLDGNALAQRLRSQPGTAAVTLVAVTGYGQELDRQRALAAGFDNHLVKPVNTAELGTVLERVGAC